MKKIVWIILIVSQSLFADITVKYNNDRPDEIILQQNIDGASYFKALELNKTLNASVEIDMIRGQIFTEIIDKSFEFFIDSPFFKFEKSTYNLHKKVLLKDGFVYLPSDFFYHTLPALLPESFKADGDIVTFLSKQKSSLDIVVIDPGHGGKDPGAIGFSKTNYEKDIVLKISQLVQTKLKTKLKIDAILTRGDDQYIDLHSRTDLANRKGAGLFVSIHCNANRSSKPNGVEVYFLSTAKTTEERAVQHLENSVVYEYEDKESIKNYSDLDLILFDMAQNEHLEASSQLAGILQKKLVAQTGFRNRGVKQAGFYVLKDAFMPAVLIEAGFISNKYEEQKLRRKSYQNKIAEAIFLGIKEFIENYKNQ